MNAKTEQPAASRLELAVDAAAERLPGSRVVRVGLPGSLHIRLGIPGLVVEVAESGDGPWNLKLRSLGRELAWRFVPGFCSPETGGGVIAVSVQDMVADAMRKIPNLRERAGGVRSLTREVRTSLTAAEREAGEACALRRGMSMAGLLRRGLMLAMAETVPDDERTLRRALRLVVSSARKPVDSSVTTIAETGSHDQVLVALRRHLREEDPEAARNRAELLGVAWLFPGEEVAAAD